METITFKKVYTEVVQKYDLDTTKTLETIYLELDTQIKSDFNCTHFEIVLAGSELSERANAIPRDCNRSIRRFMQYGNIAFYIRPYDRPSNILITNTILENRLECPICLNTTECILHYSCNHSLCSGCHISWSSTNQRNALLCPICRSN